MKKRKTEEQIIFIRMMHCAVPSRSVMSDSLRLCGPQPASLLCPWGFSRQEYCSGLPCPLPGELLDPGIKPMSLMSPVSTGEFFTTSVPGKTLSVKKGTNSWTATVCRAWFKCVPCVCIYTYVYILTINSFNYHNNPIGSVQFSCVWLFATPWTAVRQASRSITNS